MELKTEFKKDLNKVLLRIRYEGISEEDYQIHMLKNHEPEGLLRLRMFGEGEETIYEYDISEMTSLIRYYKHRKMTKEEMIIFLQKIQTVIEEVDDYLLDPNRLLLDPEYIFLSGDEYRFCYFPKGRDDIRVSFHRLMDSFVKWTDYEDISSVKTAFLLHKETMEENYSLKGIEMKLNALYASEDYLEEELKECLLCLRRNEMMFDLEVDPDLSEQRIYERQALLCRYRYLLARARELGLHTVLSGAPADTTSR